MVSQTDEYNSLRQEIFLHQTRRDQTFTFTITAISALLGFSIQPPNPFLPLLALPLAFLGGLQLAYVDIIVTRIGQHIRTEIETENPGLLWETKSYEIRKHVKVSSVAIMQVTLFTAGLLALILVLILSGWEFRAIIICSVTGIVWIALWGFRNFRLKKLSEKVNETWGTKWTLEQKTKAKENSLEPDKKGKL